MANGYFIIVDHGLVFDCVVGLLLYYLL